MKQLDIKGQNGEVLRTELMEMRSEFEDGNSPVFDQMSLCEDMVIGHQWDPDDFASNESKRKFSLTINQILPTVMQIIGQEVQNPRDIQLKNLAANTATKARLISALVKHSLDAQHTMRKRTDMFRSGVNVGRGYIGVDRDFSQDPERGDLAVKQGKSFMILPDPGCLDYDYNSLTNGARGFIVDDWYPKELVHGWWPKIQNDLGRVSYQALGNDGEFPGFVERLYNRIMGSSGGAREYNVSDDYRTNPNNVKDAAAEESRLWKHNYRVSTYLYRKYKPGAMLKRLDRPSQYMILLDKKAISNARDLLASNPERPAVLYDKDREGRPFMVPVMHKALMVGDVILDAWEDPFDGIHDYTWVRYSPYFFDGREFGIVDNLIGPQQTLNVSWSQGMNLIKQLANCGYKVAEANKIWMEWLESNGGTDGIVIPENKFGGKVEKIEPNPYPTNYDAATERSTQHIAEIANIRREMPSFDAKDMSGRAILAKQTAAMTGSALPFANYDHTSELFGVMVAKHIIQGGLYSEDEIRMLVDESDLIDQELYDQAQELIIASLTQEGGQIEQPTPPDPDIIGGLPFPEQKEAVEQYTYHKQVFNKFMEAVGEQSKELAIDMLLDELPRLKYGKISAKVTLAESAATFRERKNAEIMELNRVLLDSGYAPIPRDILIDSMDAPETERIKAAQQGDGVLAQGVV